MNDTFLGFPYVGWGTICLVIAALYFFVWPKAPGRNRPPLAHFIFRYFHSLVWLLLAAACFGRIFTAALTKIFGLAALFTYLTFIGAVVLERRNQQG